MQWRIGVECGQRWWRLSSWRRNRWMKKNNKPFYWRHLHPGVAVGPIMIYRKEKK